MDLISSKIQSSAEFPPNSFSRTTLALTNDTFRNFETKSPRGKAKPIAFRPPICFIFDEIAT
jgi:hypothetical protein